MTLLELVNKLHAARLVQADAKEQLLNATDDYEITKTEAYLNAINKGKNHTVAQQLANEATIEDKLKVSKSEMEHYQAWIECNHLVNLLSITRHAQLDPLIKDEFDNNHI